MNEPQIGVVISKLLTIEQTILISKKFVLKFKEYDEFTKILFIYSKDTVFVCCLKILNHFLSSQYLMQQNQGFVRGSHDASQLRKGTEHHGVQEASLQELSFQLCWRAHQ